MRAMIIPVSCKTICMVLSVLALSSDVFGATPQAVVDFQAIEVAMAQKIQSLEQWNLQTQRDLEKLSLLHSNIELNKSNSQKQHTQSWNEIGRLAQNTRLMIKANLSLWEEYQNINKYVASSQKSQYWLICLEQGNCNTKESLDAIDEKTIAFATKTANNAQLVKDHLEDNLALLESLKQEGATGISYADSLDLIAKVNSASLGAMYELNSQMATLLELFNQKLLNDKNKKLEQDVYIKEFFNSPKVKVIELDFNYSNKFN